MTANEQEFNARSFGVFIFTEVVQDDIEPANLKIELFFSLEKLKARALEYVDDIDDSWSPGRLSPAPVGWKEPIKEKISKWSGKKQFSFGLTPEMVGGPPVGIFLRHQGINE